MERSDLLETYRSCLQEKRRLDADLNSMSGTKTKLAQTIQDLRNEIIELQNELNSRRNIESRQLAERSALLLQIETLNNQLVEKVKRANDWENDANRQAQENFSLKQTISTLQQRSATLVSRAASATDTNKILQARISALERERDSVRNVLEGERKRSSDLAQVIMISRSKEFNQSPFSSPENLSEKIIRTITNSSRSPQEEISSITTAQQSNDYQNLIQSQTSTSPKTPENHKNIANQILGISEEEDEE